MYPVSDLYKQKIKENNRLFECKIQIEHSQGTLYLDDKDLVLGSLTFTEATQPGEEFTIGGTVASDISFTILNKPEYENIKFIGATVFVNIGLQIEESVDTHFLQPSQPSKMPEFDEKWEYVPLGRFNIDVADRQRNVIQIKAVDNMINLDKPYSLSELSYPATLYQIYTNICNIADVPVGTSDFPNKDYVVKVRPDGDLTLRDVLGYVAELAGCFAKCNRHGAIELRWYEQTDLIIEPNNRFDFKHNDDLIQIKGVMATVEDKTYLAGSEDYAIDLSENPLLQGDYETVLPNIFNNIKDTVFTPYTSDWQGNPAIQAGDIITQIDRDGKEYKTLVTKSVYKYRGRSVLEGRGLPEISRGYKGSTNRKIAEIKRKIDVEVGNKLTTLEEQQLQATELIANMLGGYAIKTEDAFYIADNEDLSQAQKVWKWGIGGFGYSENGVDGPYTTAVTAEGSIVAMLVSAGIVTADMVQTGLLQSEDGSTWINLDDGSFNLKNKIKFIDDEFSISLTNEDLEDTGIYTHHIVLSNENQSFVTDSTGKVTSETIVRTDIDTFKGTTRVASAIGTPILKNSSGTTINYGIITKTNPTTVSSGNVIWRIPANTNINSDSGWIEIPITIDDKHYVKKLYWSKAKSGNDGRDGRDGSDGEPSVLAVLSNTSHVVPTDSDGNNGNYAGCESTMSIFVGSQDDSDNWTVSATPSAGITGSLTGRTYKVTNMTTYLGYVNFTATKSGYPSVHARFNIVKAPQGREGNDTTVYWIVSDAVAIGKDKDGNYTPSTVNFTAKAQTGNNDPIDYSGRWRIYDSTDGTTFTLRKQSTVNESTISYTVGQNIKAIKVILYMANGFTNKIDEEIIPVVSDGRDGSDGENARLVDIIPSNVYFIKDLNGITPDEITLTPEFQNTSYEKWEYSTDGTSWTRITRTTSSNYYPWMNSTTRVLTIPRRWSVLNNNDYVVFRIITTTGEMDVQTISILYDVSELESRVSSAEQKITPEAIIQTVEQQVSQGGTTIATKSEIQQTANDLILKFASNQQSIRYIKVAQKKSNVNNYCYWGELEVYANGENIALGKPVTANFTPTSGSLSYYTDGNRTNTIQYNNTSGNWAEVVVDLGSIRNDIDSIIEFKGSGNADGREFVQKIEVSADGNTWFIVYDSDIHGTYVADRLNGKTFYLQGASAGIVKVNKDGIRVTHSGSNQYSEIRADGFVRKWEYGESVYLSDIYVAQYTREAMSVTSIGEIRDYMPMMIPLPQRFRNRSKDRVKIFLVPVDLFFWGNDIRSNGRVVHYNRYSSIILEVIDYHLDTSTPFVDIDAIQYAAIEFPGESSSYEISEMTFLIIVISY